MNQQRGPVRHDPVKTWLLAIRIPTLTAAVAPVAVGSAVALSDGRFAPLPALAALIGALAIQAGANLANDLSDFRRGADTDQRLGPLRVTQQGMLTERAVTMGVTVSFLIATLAGLYLTAVAGWPVVAMGVASMVAALAYTGGPWPFGYRALGELFTFIFFGVIAVVGTYYVQAHEVSRGVLAASLPVGMTVTAILVVNNVRDIETDRAAGKRTLAVVLGRTGGRVLFVALLVAAYLAAAAMWVFGEYPAWTLLPFLSAPLAVQPAEAVLSRVDGPSLNRALRATARLHLVFALLFSCGLTIGLLTAA
ncbi:MAG: 1,4-dihydroxy-2-naphthoate polyprenyltransferase [Chloroflexi bacterium]|nr:MAG: 1,4-dihydroxy-2-naphthoate polyprenyltransferase [Chloroflexota bacterium]